MEKRFKVALDILPPSNNEYLKPGIQYKNGKAFPYMYESAKSKDFKKYFRSVLLREIEQQEWDRSVTSSGHWYLEAKFVQSRVDQDCNNYFKILLDSMTGYAFVDDKNVLPRVHNVTYNSKSPSFTLVLRRVAYIGLFENESTKNKFQENCIDCKFYKNGKCAVLKQIYEGRENDYYIKESNTCSKQVIKKGK